MKICMIVPNPAVKGGIASVVNGYRGSDFEKVHQISYVESYCDGSKIQKFWKAVSGYWAFARQLLLNRPDVVHVHSSFGPSFYRKIPFIYLGRWAGIPVVNHIHGAEFEVFYEQASTKKKKRIEKVYGKCTRLVVLSEEWKDTIARIVPAEKIDVVENYCKIPDIPYDTGRKPEQILFLGELGERKGCYDIPSIFEQIKQRCPQAHLIMAGEGQIQQLKEAFAQKNLSDEVEFPGWIRGEAKEKLLRESAVFLFPTYHEGMPMAVLEAMGYGMGIVTTQVGGIPKLIFPGKTGYLEEPGAVQKIAQDVISLLQEEELCRKLGQQARKLAEEKYSLEAHFEKLEQTYRKACME